LVSRLAFHLLGHVSKVEPEFIGGRIVQNNTMPATEFMRRYLQHVLPAGQHRVHYFGWLHPARKAQRILVETLLAVVIIVRTLLVAPPPWHRRCPHCAAFALVRIGRLARAPPTCR
jgi:hypothetical protein